MIRIVCKEVASKQTPKKKKENIFIYGWEKKGKRFIREDKECYFRFNFSFFKLREEINAFPIPEMKYQ